MMPGSIYAAVFSPVIPSLAQPVGNIPRAPVVSQHSDLTFVNSISKLPQLSVPAVSCKDPPPGLRNKRTRASVCLSLVETSSYPSEITTILHAVFSFTCLVFCS